jgi:hypothetical protein
MQRRAAVAATPHPIAALGGRLPRPVRKFNAQPIPAPLPMQCPKASEQKAGAAVQRENLAAEATANHARWVTAPASP